MHLQLLTSSHARLTSEPTPREQAAERDADNKRYSTARNRFIWQAEREANEAAGPEPVPGDDAHGDWCLRWNASFHAAMNRLAAHLTQPNAGVVA